jgi:hypothetical protein
MDLAAGGEFFPTSLLTHVAALVIGLYGAMRMSLPRGVWWKTAVALVGLMLVCRLLTPEAANVNVAFAVAHGWEEQFTSHARYLASTIAGATFFFFVAEWLLRTTLCRRATKRLSGDVGTKAIIRIARP